MQCAVGFAFVSAQPASAKIGNNLAIACQLPWTWREVKDGRKAPVIAGFASAAKAVYASAEEAGFADAAHYDFRLNPDAKLLRDLPAFQPIPIKKLVSTLMSIAARCRLTKKLIALTGSRTALCWATISEIENGARRTGRVRHERCQWRENRARLRAMSLRTIARKLGVSSTTVSLALKNSPRISAGLRARIHKTATAAGYVPNARLAELMNEVRQSQHTGYRATLGVISLFPEEKPWCQRAIYAHLQLLLSGAQERAELHGYKLDHFWVKWPGMTPERLRAIIEARGIKGLLCLGSLDPEEMLPEALQKFAVVTQGTSIPGRLHRVCSHFTADAAMLWEELSRRGYTRPGLAMLGTGDRRTGFLYSASFLSHHERKLPGAPLPILRAETWKEVDFARWFETHRPDVVVMHQYPPYIAAVAAWLTKRKLRVPRDMGIALLDKNPNCARYAGVCQDPRRIGTVALEMLLGRLLLRDFEIPVYPKVELVEGDWNEGRSLRARINAG